GGRAGDVHSDVAAPNHNHPFPDRELVAEIHVKQEIDSFINAVQIHAGNGEIAATMSSNRDQHSVEALVRQVGDHEIAAGRLIQLESDVAGIQNFADLRFHNVAR